jgi:dienelactone hydrolase
MEIPAYLVLPKGVPAKDLPAVMLIHGGPWSRVYWGYTAEAQFLANRGYAVLVPNFRGSTGYGKTFLNAGNGQWGTGSMQHDITDGVKYLVARGIADPKKVAIYGGSYGGYATLAGLAFTPELYAAGISYVGPSNIITLLKSIPPYWAPMKRTFAIRVGDIENPADVKRLEAQSPLNSSRHISAPLLVVQGANDPRVKKAESDQIVVAMRDLHRPVEYMVAPDEGHGFAGRENRLAMYTAMERFFAKHLGGRVQEAVPTEIARKLEALTVDVSTVTLPVAPAEPPAPRALFSGGTVNPGTAKFLTQFSAMGQKISMNTTRTITAITAQGAALWRIVDESSGMMGTALDTLDVDATTLAAIARGSAQGGSTVALRFTAGGVKGSMVARGTTLPVDVKTDGPVISDGAGIELAVAALPLAAGYRGSTAIFDLMARKVRPYTITVTGKEQATTSGGAVDAWVIDVKPTDGESGAMKFWVSVSAPQVVRSEMELPAQMGGGKVVTELVK